MKVFISLQSILSWLGLFNNFCQRRSKIFKNRPDPSNLIFEMNVRKRRIEHTTNLKLKDVFLDLLKIYWRFKFSVIISRIRFLPTLILKIKWLWSELSLKNSINPQKPNHFHQVDNVKSQVFSELLPVLTGLTFISAIIFIYTKEGF